ncbi:MAG: malate dehydrogenase, partial [Campylobacterota bacterium]|nr:malate dehydrogenase [Campylobacterota bacterium]
LMVEAVLSDKKQIYPCAVMLDGEYGYTDTVSGVPVMIGANGAEKVIEANLNDDQDRKFAKSVGSVKELIDALYENGFYTK